MTKEFTIDCLELNGRKASHEYLAKVFAFPEYYGGNLDALSDCLTDIEPIEITIINVGKCKAESYGETIVNFLRRLSNHEEGITVKTVF